MDLRWLSSILIVPLPGILGSVDLPSAPFLQSMQQFLRRPSSAFDSSAYTFSFRRPSNQPRQSAGNFPLFPTPFTHLHQPQAWMHLEMDSDSLPKADTSLFDPGFPSVFGSSSSSYSQAYDSQSISPLQSEQDMELCAPEYTTGESHVRFYTSGAY
ncbi:hypothetical protein BDQ17DRAFT_773827 [Cyathus striatus]|nr:hypothetical protein BDQ17DRAFT_773827 [Cyathus striatus]